MHTEKKPYRLIVSGGGTGGHIFPAIAIADQFRKEYPDAEVLFIGAKGRMEMERVPKAGYDIKGLWISGIQRRLTLDNLMFPVKLIWSILKAGSIIRSFKPDAVVGTGGYASGPTVISASRKGIPVLLQEQNSFPGLTNRKLARYAKKVCVAYPHMERYFEEEKVVFTGNPVRPDIHSLGAKKAEALTYFKLSEEKKTVLILGGSLGARTINESMAAEVNTLLKEGFQVIWQTGKLYFEEMKQKVSARESEGLIITQFIDKMELAYAVADIAISRAGALSISELCLAELPVVFVPSPNVADDHQTKNALSLVEEGAAVMVTDVEAREKLVSETIALFQDEKKLEALRVNIRRMAKPDATKDIVEELKLILN